MSSISPATLNGIGKERSKPNLKPLPSLRVIFTAFNVKPDFLAHGLPPNSPMAHTSPNV